MKPLSSTFVFRTLLALFMMLLLLVSLAAAILWIASEIHQTSETFTFHGSVYHFQSQRGHLSLTIFSTTPEDDVYRTAHLSSWLVEALTLPAPLVLLMLILQKRRRARTPGFPLSNTTANPKAPPPDTR